MITMAIVIVTMFTQALCEAHSYPIVTQTLKMPQIPKNIKCSTKKETLRLPKLIADSWVNMNSGSKDKTIGKIYSLTFDLMDGNDANSIDVLSYHQRLFDHYLRCGYFSPDEPANLQMHMADGKEKVENILKTHPGLDLIENSVAYTSQGLEVVPPKVQEYVRNRDIIDAGAFIGDSMIILQNFTDRHIYGYEPNPKLYAKIQKGIKDWNFNTTKNLYFNKGLGDEMGFLYMSDSYGASQTKKSGTEKEKITITTIQNESEQYNITIGAIKADTEGYSWPIVLGGLEKIKKDRPVILIQVYHCYDEFVKLPNLIRELGNYIIQYRADFSNPRAMYETQIVAYPAEVQYPSYNVII